MQKYARYVSMKVICKICKIYTPHFADVVRDAQPPGTLLCGYSEFPHQTRTSAVPSMVVVPVTKRPWLLSHCVLTGSDGPVSLSVMIKKNMYPAKSIQNIGLYGYSLDYDIK